MKMKRKLLKLKIDLIKKKIRIMMVINKPFESIKKKIDKDKDLGTIYYYIIGKISTEYLSKLSQYDISEKNLKIFLNIVFGMK